MTEQDKRYVAEKMLGWKYDADLDIWGLADGWVPIEAGWNLPKFNPDDPEYLGPLWEALWETCNKMGRGNYDITLVQAGDEAAQANVNVDGDAWKGLKSCTGGIQPNPNLAVIAAHKALGE